MKFSKFIIIALLVAGLLAIAQHHHHDGEEHADCPVCALVQHGLDYTDYTPQVTVFWVVVFVLVNEKSAFKANSRSHFHRPRGPPALVA